MAIIEIHPQEIIGNWHRGDALDLQTTSSTPIGENMQGHMQFDTVRPAIAEHLYQLKYRNNQNGVADIIDTAVNFLRPHQDKFDIIVPVPASNQRPIQPVQLLANGIGAALGVPVSNCVTTTRPTTPLKAGHGRGGTRKARREPLYGHFRSHRGEEHPDLR